MTPSLQVVRQMKVSKKRTLTRFVPNEACTHVHGQSAFDLSCTLFLDANHLVVISDGESAAVYAVGPEIGGFLTHTWAIHSYFVSPFM